ncbi:kihadalactone A synthase LFS-like [Silene latifolia]|uniref:kihadalactone A synthase LFS-like n=1 Tax=Silene latifolia TaxID=37657 RepID=UPI003D76E64C
MPELLPTWRPTVETYHRKLLGRIGWCNGGSVPGLQVCREKDCHPCVWEDVHHIEGAFIVNIGDLMERWTNGLFRSTLHRVNPKGKERYSAAFFCDPHADIVVECLESCCDESNPSRFRPIRAGDYFRERFRLTYGD